MQAGLAPQPVSWRGALAATPPAKTGAAPGVYRRHRPETTALYEVVRDNLETLFGAIDDGALAVRIPRHARKELLAYLDCGLLCRGFARLKCRACAETRLVALAWVSYCSPFARAVGWSRWRLEHAAAVVIDTMRLDR